MAHKLYIGIDNGVTGTLACRTESGSNFVETPVVKEQSYTKAKQNISRINHLALKATLLAWMEEAGASAQDCIAVIERPMINPTKFKASISAARSLESTLCVLESLGIPRMYFDSRDWQKDLLPKGVKGAPELKKASLDIGLRLFPQHEKVIHKHGDADALLIAEQAHRKQL